jgi:ankyrin repeat protein
MDLHDAVEEDDVDEVVALLASGADVSARDIDGVTPLHLCRSRAVADVLLAAGALPSALSLKGIPAISCVTGVGALEAALDAAFPTGPDAGPGAREASFRFPDFMNRQPTHVHASNRGTAGIDDGEGAAAMSLLFSRGFSPDATDDADQTPLMFAAMHAPLTAMAILEAGADPRARSFLGATALHNCCDADLAAALIARGADPSARMIDGCSPLHTNACPRVTAVLLSNGADASARIDVHLHTALHLAESKERAMALVAHGADLEARNADGDTPLIARADCRRPCAETIAALLDAGADPTAVSTNGASVISSFAGLTMIGRLTVAGAVARSLARAETMRLGGAYGQDEDLEAVLANAYPRATRGPGASRGPGATRGPSSTEGHTATEAAGSTQPTQPPSVPEEAWRPALRMPVTAVTSYNPATEAGTAAGAAEGAPEGAAGGAEATAYQMDPMLVAEFHRSVAAEICFVAGEALREAQRARQESKEDIASLGHWVACAVSARKPGIC